MIYENSIKLEINKLLIYLHNYKNYDFIPTNINEDSVKIYNPRDSSIIVCSLIYLVNINKIKLNEIILIILNYIKVEFEIYISLEKNIPNNINNSLNTVSNCKYIDFDIIAFRLITLCNIYDLLKSNNLDYLVIDILIGNKLIEKYLNLLSNYCDQKSINLWEKDKNIYFCNVKLNQIALNKSWIILKNFKTDYKLCTFMETSEQLKNLSLQFEKKCFLNGSIATVIIPSLQYKKTEIVNKYFLNSSIFLPFFPIFDSKSTFCNDIPLYNTALIILNNHYTEPNKNYFIKKNIYKNIPFISSFNNPKNVDNYCAISSILIYYFIIKFDDSFRNKTLISNWNSINEYKEFKNKIISKYEDLFEKINICCSSKIDCKSKKCFGNYNSNITRMMSSCFSFIIKKYTENNSYSNIFDFTPKEKPFLNRKPKDELLETFSKLKFNSLSGFNEKKLLLPNSLSKIDEEESITPKEKCGNCIINDNLEKIKLSAPDCVSIENIISLAENYYCFDCKRKKNVELDEILSKINMDRIVKIRDPLKKLLELRGLENIKDVLLDNIIYFLINEKKNELLHMCIMGPPGVGKTVIANIIAEIYKNLGILSKGHIVKASRSDLIGKYLGHTASKTSDVIKEAEGGILFIDEVYSLVDRNGRDSFSKECIDTLTQYLTEKCSDLLCIIAGYKSDIEEYFFSSNKGLERRFAFKFNIEGYSFEELFNIYCDKMKLEGWIVNLDKNDEEQFLKLFKEKYDLFKNFGGDIENLVYRYNIVWNKNNFFKLERDKNISYEITKTSIDNLFSNKKNENKSWKHMYM